MAGRVLAVVDGTATGVHRRALAAAGLAQRLVSEAGLAADVVVVGFPGHPPGRWQRAWRSEASSPQGLAGELAGIVNGDEYLAVIGGDTPFGRELCARLAVRLGAPVVAPVLSLRLQGGSCVLSGRHNTAPLLQLSKSPGPHWWQSHTQT
ncbi:MAG: hypothetical protein IPI33_13145 [Dehalococcoidia bacterium]|nr:hypothetical protein [Dehalococcoidia bacterium]